MKRRAPSLLLLVILLPGLVSCSGARRTPAPASPPPTLAPAGQAPRGTASGGTLEAGRERVAAGDLKAAEELFRAALAADPGSGQAQVALSRLHLDLGGRDAEALSEAQEAVRLAPGASWSWTALAYTLGRNMRGPEALQAARKAVSLREQDAGAHAVLAYALLLQRQPSGALDAARRAVWLEAGSPEAYASLAKAYEANGNFAYAKAAMEKAVSLEPLNLKYQTRLGELLANMALYDDAASVLQAVVERGRKVGLEYLPAIRSQADLALLRGDIPAADEITTGLLRLAPTDTDARLARARLYWRRADFRAAEAAFREAIQHAPDSFDARLGLAQLQLEDDQCAVAAEGFRALAAEQPRFANPLIGQARAASCAHDAQRATELFKQAIDLEPCNAEALAGLGRLYAGQERSDEARQMFARAWQCSAGGANVQVDMGVASLAAGDPATAFDAFTLARRLDPGVPTAQLGLCMAYLQEGETGHALNACEQAAQEPLTREAGALARATALVAAGRYAEAVTSLQSLKGELAEGAAVDQLLGIAHIGLRDDRAALHDFEAYGRRAGPRDPRLAALVKALESGWELTPDEAQVRLAAELAPIVSRRPVSLTIEVGAGGQRLALRMAALTGETPEATLDEATALMLSASRYAPRIAPPPANGVEVQVAGPRGEALYALHATLDEARQIATLQRTDEQFVQGLHLADADPATALTAQDAEAIGAKVALLRNRPTPSGIPLVRLTRQDYGRQLSLANATSSLQRADESALEVLLGLLQPGADITQLQIDLNSSILSGFYDQDARALSLIDQAAAGWEDRLTIAHEYEHALQDRDFATGYLWDSAASEDMRQALRALEEGDAELSEAAYLRERIPVDEETFSAWTAAEAPGQEPGATPEFLAALSAFPYDAGLDFVRNAYEAGGWPAVDRLFSRPPVSTEQILHPDLYRGHHQPVAVGLPPLASRLGDDWGVVEKGVMGEAGWRVALAPAIGSTLASVAAKGWGGDRFALLRRGTGTEYAAAFQTAWDDRGEAEEFASLVGTWLDRRTGYGQEVTDLLVPDPVKHWVQGTLHWFMRSNGLRVTIVVAPGEDLARKLLEAAYPAAYECRLDTPAAAAGIDQLLAELDKQIKGQPTVKALRERAAVYGGQGDLQQAVADLDQAIQLDGEDARSYVERGRARYLRRDYAGAVADLTRGLELRPGDYTAYEYLGRAYTDQEDYTRAEQTFAEAIARYPRDPYLRQYRGDIYLSRNNYRRALAEYETATLLLPDFADPECRKALLYNVQGHFQQELGNFNDAVARFSQGLKLRPEDAEAWHDRASAYTDKGDYAKALTDFGRAVELRPEFAAYHLERGYVYVAQEDYKPALADFAKAIELEPEDAQGYYGRGYAYLMRGFTEDDAGQSIVSRSDFGKSIADFDQAIELDPEMGAAYYRRGQAYHARGHRDRAIADYTKAIDLMPDRSDPYWNRGNAYAEQGEKVLAIRDLEKYLELTDDQESRAEVEKKLEQLRAAP